MQKTNDKQAKATSKATVTLLAGGDVGSVYDPADEVAEFLLPVLRQADLRFGQCERTYSNRDGRGWLPEHGFIPRKAGVKRGPRGRTSTPLHPKLASIWETTGIDVISMASNHTMDHGPEVLLDTIDLFRSMGKQVIGAGKDIEEARRPAVVERNGVKVAFLAYCSVLPEGHEAGPTKPGIAPMRAHTYYRRGGDPHEDFQPGTPMWILTVPYEEDIRAMQDDVAKAKELADVVVMSIHWGLHRIPRAIATYQPTVAHAAIDAGVDLIIGHHPHIIKAVEVYKDKVCFYSVGNFMTTGGNVPRSEAEWQYWDLYYYHVDPECVPPEGKYLYPTDSRKEIIAKAVIGKGGIETVSFLPAWVSAQAQPTAVTVEDPKFKEILDFTEWSSQEYPHRFRVEGNEVVVQRPS